MAVQVEYKNSHLSVKLPHDSTSQPVQMEMQLSALESVLSVGSHDTVMLAKSLGHTTVSYSEPQLISPA